MDYSDLEKALALAVKAHRGQRDKSGFPYIFHPVRVMLRLKNLEAQIVALLHDILEDSAISATDLQQAGFSPTVIEAVSCLTKKEGEDYFEYISRVKGNHLARAVKLADIEDNLDANRLSDLSETDCKRMARYLKAKKILSAD